MSQHSIKEGRGWGGSLKTLVHAGLRCAYPGLSPGRRFGAFEAQVESAGRFALAGRWSFWCDGGMENLPPSNPYQAPPNPYQAQEDASHLKLLAIFYFIFAGLGVLGTLGFLVLFVTGTQFFGDPGIQKSFESQGAGFPPEIAWLFGSFGVVMLLWSAVAVLLDFLCGRWLIERKNRTFCIVVAALSCLSFPLGTALGVFTIIVLCRPSVQALFERSLSQRR